MDELILLCSNGLTFTGATLTKRCQGAKELYFHESDRPSSCFLCNSANTKFHRHGYYPRTLITLHKCAIVTILVHNLRWICIQCRHTMSFLPDDVLSYKRFCTLSTFVMLWFFVHHMTGLHDKTVPYSPMIPLQNSRTLSRYFRAAKQAAVYTHQFIREAIVEIGEPGPLEVVFKSGLSPPVNLAVRHRKASHSVSMLWSTGAMLLCTCQHHKITPSRLLARAHKKAKERNQRFLI